MRRIILAIGFLFAISGCVGSQSIQKASIVYKVYKQGAIIILPSYPTYSVKDNLVEAWKDPIASFVGDDPQWSSDGKWITYSTSRYSYTSLFSRDRSSIFIVKADGSKLYKVVNKGLNYDPTWSPDGRKVAYNSRSKIWTLDVSCFIEGHRNCQSDPVLLVDGFYPDWSPNGEKIAFETSEQHIGVVSLNDPKKQIEDLTPEMQISSDPDWSPDGKRMIFSTYNTAKDTLDIILLDLAEGRVDNLTNGIGFNIMPKWSKDGERIVFISSDREDLGNMIGLEDTVRSRAIFSMNPQGLDLKRIGGNNDEEVLWYSVLP